MSADALLIARLAHFQRRFRIASLAVAGLVGCAAAGVVFGVAAVASDDATTARIVAALAFVAAFAALAARAWRRWSVLRVARAIEQRQPLDNLIVTAEEAAAGRVVIRHEPIREALFADAITRLQHVDPRRVQPLARSVIVTALALVATGTVLTVFPSAPAATASGPSLSRTEQEPTLSPGAVRIVITPPAYARREPTIVENPPSLTALEGSEIHIEVALDQSVAAIANAVTLHEMDGTSTPFTVSGARAVLNVVATTSRPLLIRQRSAGSALDRVVHLRVERDEPPGVAIREPAKDLMFPVGRGDVPVQVEARDDVGLASLSLRYTRVSGSGETFTFEEGEWPVQVERQGPASWRARAVLSLDALKLEDGDTLVYRAVARDAKPGSDPASSDTFLIEIGRLAGVASQGFALPEERDRQAISQQMLIIKTERLHADKATLSAEAFLEQSQLLAVEQRMVKAEFVFMTGGHVEDEVAEAEHSHELAEGRLENSAQVELLAAIREMSRAEARLNAADTAGALEFERAALKALQRAFDRRRYLLRTLPERARIDVTRRLTGELETARSSTMNVETSPDPAVQNGRAVLQQLSGAVRPADVPAIASRMLALDATSEPLQKAALALTTAPTEAARTAALRNAQAAVAAFLRERMAAQATLPLQADPLRGRMVQELPGSRRP